MVLSHILLLLSVGCFQIAQTDNGRAERAAPYTGLKLWDLNISFIISDEFNSDEKTRIRAGIQTIQDNTCVNFTENGPGKKLNYNRKNATTCWAVVGNNPGIADYQPINLGVGCMSLGTIQHETIHALGFAHTQKRPDRDQHVTINFTNIPQDWHAEYYKLDKDESKTNYGIPYEFNSVMHYTDKSIEIIDGDYAKTMGGIKAIFNDWKIINIHYKCNETCPAPIECLNGGYQNPRECERCVCPQFHNGAFCEHEREALILPLGGTLKLNKEIVRTTLVYNTALKREGSPQIIKAPEGSRILVTIESISDPGFTCPDTCDHFGLEIVDGDMTRVGKRFCCPDSPRQLPYSFNSSSNVLGWYAYARPGLNFGVNATFTVMGGSQTTVELTTAVPGIEQHSTAQPTTELPETEAITEAKKSTMRKIFNSIEYIISELTNNINRLSDMMGL